MVDMSSLRSAQKSKETTQFTRDKTLALLLAAEVGEETSNFAVHSIEGCKCPAMVIESVELVDRDKRSDGERPRLELLQRANLLIVQKSVQFFSFTRSLAPLSIFHCK